MINGMVYLLNLLLVFNTAMADSEDLSALNPMSGRGFVKAASIEAGQLVDLQVEVDLQDGFFAYHDKIRLKPSLEGASLGELFIDPIVEFDDTISKKKKRGVHEKATITTQLQLPAELPADLKSLAFELTYIACTKKFCLTPRVLAIEVPVTVKSAGTASPKPELSSSDFIQKQIDQNLALALVLIFAFGFLTSLTPCVYPLIPITLAVLGTQLGRTRGQSFLTSVIYVLGIGVTYALLGVIAAQTGQLFGSLISHPIVTIAMSLVFILMGFSVLGFFEIQAPAFLRNRANTQTQKGYGGAFVSGLLAGVIASPCVGPVLVGVLAYIAKNQNSVLGFALLFTFAMGFGILFIVLGTFSQLTNKIPRSGAWMNTVKMILALCLFGMAAYYSWPLIQKQLGTKVEQTHDGQWQKYSPELVAQAKAEGKPVIIDFFADWCAACVELDQFTFSKPEIKEKTANYKLLKVDATSPTDELTKLTEKYKVFGLPTIILINSKGEIREDLTLTGFEEAKEFSKRLDKL